ncbi:MAG: P27 family phage terminase small subunit [Firmicutes bacterium]|nr:P27 family phage terminase small subunit [Bacillota bacterium]
MNKAEWLRKIKKAVRAVGTYQASFDAPMDTLAGILERRDKAVADFEASGSVMVYPVTNTQGETVLKQNPLLKTVNELNRDALAYWRDLGLTPAGLKRINDTVVQKKETGSALVAALLRLGDGA